MRRIRIVITLAAAAMASSASLAQAFAYQGFTLGMTRDDASLLRPDALWKKAMLTPPVEFLRKSFPGEHLGQVAQVTVDLEPQGKSVEGIGFTYLTLTDAQCVSGAIDALARLEARYGVESDVSHEPPGKRAKWIVGGFVVRWGELCASGARQYYVTYATNGS